jgi:UV DNA damage endonuclease
MRVGYACVNTDLASASRTMRLSNATPERLREVTAANLDALESILRWNIAHRIAVFRVSSNTIPFGSHPVNQTRWWEEFADRLAEIGVLMDGMSISAHPGQYTVLGSAREEVVEASLAELEYQALLLRSFGLDTSHKLAIHLTGTPERFVAAAERLSPDTRARLVVENDERFSLDDVLSLDFPVVFDAFHHQLRPSLPELDVRGAVIRAGETWSSRQEVHFSTQDPDKRPGAHSQTLDPEAFAAFADAVGDLALDCVLEVKDKERSTLVAQAILERRAA